MSKPEKIIVIGAGLAGLYSAYLLQKQGYQVTILEARDRAGGRTYTENGVDLGGQWISGKQPRIMRLCKELNISYKPQHEEGLHISCFDQKRTTYSGLLADAGLNEETRRQIKMLEEYAEHFAALSQSSDFMTDPNQFDQINFLKWCQENIVDIPVRNIILYAFYTNTCISPECTSFFFWLYFLKLCGGYNTVTTISGGAQEYCIETGAQTVSNLLAESLHLIYNSEIKAIEKVDQTYSITTQEHKKFHADKIISTIPLQLVPTVEFSPALERERVEFYCSLKMGSITKVVIKYETPFWRDAGYSGAIISDIGPVILCYDACNQNKNALVIFVIGEKNYTDSEILNHLASLLESNQALMPKKLFKKSWTEDPYSAGCYFSIPSVDHLVRNYKYLIEPCGNIYFAGTETAREWMGYMEGALESAERVVQKIIESNAKE